MSKVERAVAAERERILLELTDLDVRGREKSPAAYPPDDEAYWEHPWCDLAAIVNGASARDVAPEIIGAITYPPRPAPLPDLPEVREVTVVLDSGEELRVGDRVRVDLGRSWCGEGTVIQLTTAPHRKPVTVEGDDGQLGYFQVDDVTKVRADDPTYTLVLIDSEPERAEDGDFIHVEGVTVDDLRDIDVLVRFREAMRERAAS